MKIEYRYNPAALPIKTGEALQANPNTIGNGLEYPPRSEKEAIYNDLLIE